MFVVMFKASTALNCEQQVFGPFVDYFDAEDFLCTLPVAAECDWKYTHKLDVPSQSVVHSNAWVVAEDERLNRDLEC